MDRHDRISLELFKKVHALYPERTDTIFKNHGADVDQRFLGFVEIYLHLSKIIPKEYVVYDMGCCYAFQSWYFRNHMYIGVDVGLSLGHRIQMPGHKHYKTTIERFINSHKIDQSESFAICNYVPPWYDCDNQELVRKSFNNVFAFYPTSNVRIKKIGDKFKKLMRPPL